VKAKKMKKVKMMTMTMTMTMTMVRMTTKVIQHTKEGSHKPLRYKTWIEWDFSIKSATILAPSSPISLPTIVRRGGRRRVWRWKRRDLGED